jgi:hypothetical protein
MAVYVDATGNQIETAPTLKATDFGDTYAIRYKDSWSKNKLITITTLGIADNTLTLGTAEDGVIHDVDDLPHLYANKGASGTGILVQTQFPYVSSTSTLAVGADDWNNDSSQKQRFFVLFVAKNMFDSTLFSQWINNDSSSNSLNWWNDYLASYSYTYTVSHEAVNSYLTTNFTYELNQNGVVVLDLDTINKVAQIYKTEADDQRVSNIRTFFMIFGWFLIGYSMILMLAWVLDANTDVGIKLLEKLTLGNWVAVKYEDDIPYRNTNDRTYLTGGKMAIKCMIIVTIGVLLIRINIFRIVLKLINLFGGFASQVQSIILGLRG